MSRRKVSFRRISRWRKSNLATLVYIKRPGKKVLDRFSPPNQFDPANSVHREMLPGAGMTENERTEQTKKTLRCFCLPLYEHSAMRKRDLPARVTITRFSFRLFFHFAFFFVLLSSLPKRRQNEMVRGTRCQCRCRSELAVLSG